MRGLVTVSWCLPRDSFCAWRSTPPRGALSGAVPSYFLARKVFVDSCAVVLPLVVRSGGCGMRKTRYTGVFQRCRRVCPERCRAHGFCFYVELSRQGSGARCQATKGGFLTAADAWEARQSVVRQHRAGLWPVYPRMTVAEWLESWFEAKVASGGLRPTTQRCYRQHLDAYLVPYLGRLRAARPAYRACQRDVQGDPYHSRGGHCPGGGSPADRR
jgi:hypothetical protein